MKPKDIITANIVYKMLVSDPSKRTDYQRKAHAILSQSDNLMTLEASLSCFLNHIWKGPSQEVTPLSEELEEPK